MHMRRRRSRYGSTTAMILLNHDLESFWSRCHIDTTWYTPLSICRQMPSRDTVPEPSPLHPVSFHLKNIPPLSCWNMGFWAEELRAKGQEVCSQLTRCWPVLQFPRPPSQELVGSGPRYWDGSLPPGGCQACFWSPTEGQDSDRVWAAGQVPLGVKCSDLRASHGLGLLPSTLLKAMVGIC